MKTVSSRKTAQRATQKSLTLNPTKCIHHVCRSVQCGDLSTQTPTVILHTKREQQKPKGNTQHHWQLCQRTELLPSPVWDLYAGYDEMSMKDIKEEGNKWKAIPAQMDRCVLVDRKVLRGKHGLPSGSYA
jgi:hypothetical protein